MTRRARRWTLVAAAAVSLAAALPALGSTTTQNGCATASGWTMYGRDGRHSFEVPPQCSRISPSTVAALAPKWFVHTGSAVTASPAVAGGVVYVGSWDGTFYALDAADGSERWRFSAPAPYPTAFGVIVSTATVVTLPDAHTRRPREIVLFGAADRLYALDAATGRGLASLGVDPRSAALRKKQAANPPVVEIESSPVVATVHSHGRPMHMVYVGMDVHNDAGVGPAGLIAAQLVSARDGRWSLVPVWKSDPETGKTYRGAHALTVGSGTGFGCGDVWSSPAVDVTNNLVAYGVGNCDDPEKARAAGDQWSEAIVAVRADTGATRWRFAPESLLPKSQQLAAAHEDADFGASPNMFSIAGHRLVVGDGSKNGSYYAIDAVTGKLLWHTAAAAPGYVQQNFAVGGFLGSSAVQTSRGRAQQIIGASAVPVPHSATEAQQATWQVRSLDARTGAIKWVSAVGGPTYAATTIVNGLALVPDTTNSALYALDASTGLPLWSSPVIGPPSSAATVAGNSVYLGTGTTESDLEYKSFGLVVPQKTTTVVGQGPLDPVSGVQAWQLVTG